VRDSGPRPPCGSLASSSLGEDAFAGSVLDFSVFLNISLGISFYVR